jgi:HSP20 family protein
VVASAITTVSAAVFYGLVAFSVRQRGLADAVLSAGDLFERVEMRRQRDYYGAAMRSLPDVCHLLAGYGRSNPPSTSSEKEAVMPGALTHWEPFAELGELRSCFDRMFEELTDGRQREWTPAIDVVHENGNLLVRADVPGIKPEEVKIEVEDDILTVSGEHEERKEEKDKPFLRRERRYGSFCRSMALPPGVEAKKIKAKTHDGVVEVTVPLPKEAKKETIKITPTAA